MRLRDAREEAGFTQEEIAELLDCPSSSISRLEGKRTLSNRRDTKLLVYRMAIACGYEPEEFGVDDSILPREMTREQLVDALRPFWRRPDGPDDGQGFPLSA